MCVCAHKHAWEEGIVEYVKVPINTQKSATQQACTHGRSGVQVCHWVWFVTVHMSVSKCVCVHAVAHKLGQGSWGRYPFPGRGNVVGGRGWSEPQSTHGPPGMFPAMGFKGASPGAATHLGGHWEWPARGP